MTLKNKWILLNNQEEFKEFINKYRCDFGDLFDILAESFINNKNFHQNTFPTVISYRDSALTPAGFPQVGREYAFSFQPLREDDKEKQREYFDNIKPEVWRNPENFPEYFL